MEPDTLNALIQTSALAAMLYLVITWKRQDDECRRAELHESRNEYRAAIAEFTAALRELTQLIQERMVHNG